MDLSLRGGVIFVICQFLMIVGRGSRKFCVSLFLDLILVGVVM